MSLPDTAHLVPLPGRQLPLPLAPPEPAPPVVPLPLRTLPARRVWASLGEGERLSARVTLLHTIQEVLNEPDVPDCS